jgi:hypothetical protein
MSIVRAFKRDLRACEGCWRGPGGGAWLSLACSSDCRRHRRADPLVISSKACLNAVVVVERGVTALSFHELESSRAVLRQMLGSA